MPISVLSKKSPAKAGLSCEDLDGPPMDAD